MKHELKYESEHGRFFSALRLLSLSVLFSGNANNGAGAGLVYSNSNNTPSNTNTNISSQLIYKPIRDKTLPLGKKSRTQHGAGSFGEGSVLNSRS